METRFRRLASILLVALPMLVHARPASGAIVLSATDAGFVTIVGGSAKGDGTVTPGAKYNYSVGRELHYGSGDLGAPLVAMDRKNYFVFDLTSVTSPIASAVLKVYAGPASAPPFPGGGAHGYESLDTDETYAIAPTMDPPGALAMITALAGATLPAAFDDPGDPLVGEAAMLYMKLAIGPALAFKIVSPVDDGTTIPLTFTAAGIGYLNSFLGSKVILGGFLPTAMPPASPQSIFGFTGPDIAGGDLLTPSLELTLVVPEAGSALCVAVGLALMGVLGLRRGQRSVD